VERRKNLWCLVAYGLNIIIFIGGQYSTIKREKGRLQAIEDLINSKMPSVAVDEGSVTHYENNVDEVVEKAEAVELACIHTQ
jgi:Tfp pilus assembly ATPase PilU